MKFSESWLREWINPKMTREQLCEKLTMAGLEIEELAAVAENFSGVVVGQVVQVTKHPEADRLNICEVDVGGEKPLTIVCGANNVITGMKVPAALDKAVLPHNLKISVSKIRGVTSEGMLCTAHELGLAEESAGLFVLPQHAPVGKDVWEYLNLSDYLIDVSITPNRGDCLSIMGIAKEVSALTDLPLNIHQTPEIISAIADVIPVTIQVKEDCPRYVGRVIRGVKADASSPIWLQERLRRSGIRSISPVVDVTNFVMLELGQPMHAFSLDKIAGGIQVRKAQREEKLALLDGSEVTLDTDTLVIADDKKALAIAGVMGGLESGVSLLTQDIFLESAYFTPNCIARAGRRYKLGSDSSYRFERGVDPTLQRIAVERATQLLLDIVDGKPGPVIEVSDEKYLPQPMTIELRTTRVAQILGLTLSVTLIEIILQRLGFSCKKMPAGLMVTVPARRSDITLEIDLIEEIARLYGYDNIPCHSPIASMQINPHLENKVLLQSLRRGFADLGFHEVITYTFVDKKLQALLDPQQLPKELVNPITADMDVMRTSLWPGLVNTLLYNQNRQQDRVRIFETGLRFVQQGENLLQQRTLSGLISGAAVSEQWGSPKRPVDFFDLKGDLQNIIKLTGALDEFSFVPGKHSALHPGQTAEIHRNGQFIGILGALHPGIMQSLKIEGKVFVFDLLLEKLEAARVPKAQALSKFPEIRRDIAIVIDQAVPVVAIQDTITKEAGDLLKQVDIFDVYQGKGIADGRKSIALSLTLQHSSRTLIDEDVTDLLERVIGVLKGRFNAELRG